MSKKAFKRSPKTEEARNKLIALSAEAQQQAALLAAATGEVVPVNSILLAIYKDETGCSTFRRFDEWKEAGFTVKKGETAFRVWGSPIKAKKNTEQSQEPEGDTVSKFKFWPMCCLFNESQVEPIDAANDATVTGAEESNVFSIAPSLCIGERVETILRTKDSGNFGEYLGRFGLGELVKADEITFHIIRGDVEPDHNFWTVKNVHTGKVAAGAGEGDLISAVREAAASEPTPPTGNRRRPTKPASDSKGQQGETGTPAADKPAAQHQAAESSSKPQAAQASTGNPARAAKLRKLADQLTAKIEHCFASRLENTAKRIAQAAHARLDGYRHQRTQAALAALADLVEQGTAPAALASINSIKAMHELMAGKKELVSNGFHSYHTDTGEPAGSSPEVLAAWALLTPLSDEEIRAEQLRGKINSLHSADIPGYFPSPEVVVNEILDRAELESGLTVADTSAGTGAILDGVREAYGINGDAYEINYTLSEILSMKGFVVRRGNSLEVSAAKQYDRILINPPFERLQDVDHIRHSFDNFLKAGGRLVAVCSSGTFTNSCKKAQEFRQWFAALGGTVEDLPPASFKESGTNVNTKIITLDKPKARAFILENGSAKTVH